MRGKSFRKKVSSAKVTPSYPANVGKGARGEGPTIKAQRPLFLNEATFAGREQRRRSAGTGPARGGAQASALDPKWPFQSPPRRDRSCPIAGAQAWPGTFKMPQTDRQAWLGGEQHWFMAHSCRSNAARAFAS